MDWIEVIVHTTTPASDLVTETLINSGAQGTMVEDRADVPDPTKPNGYWEIIDPHMIDAMPEDVLVHAWFEPDASFPDRLQGLKTRYAQLLNTDLGMDPGSLSVETRNVKDQDWNEVWKQFYKPFRAGTRLVVKPTWEAYEAQEGDLIIEMDPGMAFGSGTHETTGMCLALLETVVTPGSRVIDVGTGSGILAIGAGLLGATDVLAVDIDPTAVKVAKENIEHNHMEKTVRPVVGNLLDGMDDTCDICVANIIADVIISFAAPLLTHIRPGGTFICSGIIREREEDVRTALLSAGYSLLRTEHRGEWTAFLSQVPGGD